MSGVPTSLLLRLLLALISLLLGVPAGDGGDPPANDATPVATHATTHVATCAADAAPPPTADGRVRLVLEARPPAGVRITPETVRAACDVMAARLGANGLDATLAVDGGYRVLIDVSTDEDVERVGRLTTFAGLLEIVDPRGKILLEGTLVTTTLGGPADVLPPSAYAGETIDDSAYETIVSGADIEDAYVDDRFGYATVGFELSDDAADRFYRFTSANIGRPLAILVDKRVVSSPTIHEAISGVGTISGVFTDEEVADLVAWLSSEPLPVPFEVVEVDGTPVAGGA